MSPSRTAAGRVGSRILAIAALTALLVPAGTAHALVIPRGVETLARRAHSVVVARVTAVVPRWSSSGEIVSDVDLAVERRLAGSGSSTVRVTVPGGQIGDIGMVIDEAPRFASGQRCVLFLDSAGRVVADRQGKMDVVGDRVPGVGQSLATVETRVRRAVTPPTSDPWYGVVQELVASAPEVASVMAAGTPVVSGITLTSQSAGTGSIVTIRGSGFGSVQGGVTFYRYPGARLPGTVLSWSDTSIVSRIPSGAGSDTVIVTDSGGTASAGYSYTVGFSYSGRRWVSTTMTYYVNPNCLDAGADELTGIDAGAAAWNVPSAFRFVYGGATGVTQNIEVGNHTNEIFWAQSGFSSPDTLAINRYWYHGSQIDESDIVFNDAYPWGDASVDGGVLDIASVAVHEMGHSLSLDDQYGAGDSGKVMYGFGSADHVHRALSAADAEGIAYVFRTDTAAPIASASVNGSTVPAGSTTAWLTSASVALSVNESATRYYNLDSSGQTTYASAFGVTPDGTHSVQYWAVDTAGNTGSLNSITVRVDSAPPTTSALVGATYMDSASITIVPSDTGGSGVAWTDYRLDSSTIASGPIATITALGAHTIEHRAVDNAGNAGAWSTLQSFAVLASPPAAPSGVTVGASTPTPAILLGWVDNATNETGYVIERSENGGAFAQIATPAAGSTSLKDTLGGSSVARQWGSTWTYRVKAVNTGGSSSFVSSAGLRLDTTAPTTSASVSMTYVGSASITIVPSDSQSGVWWTDYQIDSSTPASGTVATTSALGAHTIRHRAADVAGNLGSWSTPQAFTVIATPPPAPAAPSGLSAGASTPAPAIALAWSDNSSNEDNFVVERSEDGGSFVEMSTPAANATSYKDTLGGLSVARQWGSTWTYRVKAVNTGGSSSFVSSTGMRLDVTAPTTSASVSMTYVGSASITIVPSDSQSGVWWTDYQIDSSTPASGTVATTSVLGAHTIRHRAADVAGNLGSWSTPQSFMVVAVPITPPTPVYRFYNLKMGVHFYTASASEMATVRDTLSRTYHLEGIAYSLNTGNPDNNTALYRFYNIKQGVHFYTASASEMATVRDTMRTTYLYEGVAYNVSLSPAGGATPVYRFYNIKQGVHFYTASASEMATVRDTMRATYRLEGVGYYLAP